MTDGWREMSSVRPSSVVRLVADRGKVGDVKHESRGVSKHEILPAGRRASCQCIIIDIINNIVNNNEKKDVTNWLTGESQGWCGKERPLNGDLPAHEELGEACAVGLVGLTVWCELSQSCK